MKRGNRLLKAIVASVVLLAILTGVAVAQGAVEVMSRDGEGPAVQSDLRPGDLIVAVNSVPVDGIDALHRHVSRWPVGTPLALSILRRTQRLEIELTPKEFA